MIKANKIENIKSITDVQTKQIERQVSLMSKEYEEEKSKLLELIAYRQEYESQQRALLNKGISADTVFQQRLFINKISAAIEQQQNILLNLSESLNNVVNDWKKSHIRDKAIDSLLDHYQKMDIARESKREQKDVDDIISRRRPFASH